MNSPTAAIKKKKFDIFWKKCFNTLEYLSTVDEYVAKYKSELDYAFEWRRQFFYIQESFSRRKFITVIDCGIINRRSSWSKR